ncbi:PREDICTED: lactosylceramide 4-alpha-galactosyltransferase [Nanorana parkeri]|uniref:lactosylceramide 4-alpha-galactosyltransferase n=1 Tax=Nanorana parkeri TaxID=125878 RepID=UPI000854797C|nr:PREDICTED: lactosylceramide 4-alpha-galactosyltransferase [Nanorana parkeri]
MYLKMVSISEEEAIIHLLPKEVVCPDNVPVPSNTSHAIRFSGGIYFVETSDRTSPTFQTMCAVESAARAHPNVKVTVLMKGLNGRSRQDKNFGTSLLRCFPNIEFLPLDFKKLFNNTPLNTWYSKAEGKNQRALLDYPTLSDACRLAILWKAGGIYLDMDFIILKNLENITNSMGMQSLYTLNGAFLTFQPQHKFIELCMKDFVGKYNYWLYGHQGPQLLTRVFKKWCPIHRLRDKKSCQGVNVLPKEAFYPVDWQDWKKYFQVIDPTEMEKLLKDSYGVHLWNKKSQGHFPEVGSLLEQLQVKHCPTTDRLMKMYH